MFDVYFFGKFSVYGKYQETPDSQTTVFKQMYKELKKSRYSEAIMFKRLDNQRIYYSYVRRVGFGQYFGIGIVCDKNFNQFGDLCLCFRNIIRGLKKRELIIKQHSSNSIKFACSSFKKCGTEIGLFLSNWKIWNYDLESLMPLAGNVGIGECIVREFIGNFEDANFKNLSDDNSTVLNTYTQILTGGYPNFFVGFKKRNRLASFIIALLIVVSWIVVLYDIGYLTLTFGEKYDWFSLSFEETLRKIIYFWK